MEREEAADGTLSDFTTTGSSPMGPAAGTGVAVAFLYSDAFFARKLPQLDNVALAAAPAVAPISVAAVAAWAAAVAEGAKDSGRNPPRMGAGTGAEDVPTVGVAGDGG